jgi:hypothetical protein
VSSGKRFTMPLWVAVFGVSEFIEFQKGKDQEKSRQDASLPAPQERLHADRTVEKVQG